MIFSLKRFSLLWRILLSTSLAMGALLGVTGWFVQAYAVRLNRQSIDEEIGVSLEAFKARWSDQTRMLASTNKIISSMSDVRAAFATRDRATIRDSAQELWSRISHENVDFLVLSPDGEILASLGGNNPRLQLDSASLKAAMDRFPNQVSGFITKGPSLFYVVLTPVYVQGGTDQELLNILLAGFEVNRKFADTLKRSGRDSDFAFLASGHLVASTLPVQDSRALETTCRSPGSLREFQLNGNNYVGLSSALTSIEGKPIADLCVFRSFAAAQRSIRELRRTLSAIWLVAIVAGLGLSYLLARYILKPLKRLDRAATEVARRNYDYRVPVENTDELGRLATTFNRMCDSIRSAREDLIRNERIAAIGRLSTSIVHDFRNPLAAIYGGAEMLVDSDLSPSQSKRLARNIYTASRRIQELLNDLLNISGGRRKPREECRLIDIVLSANDSVSELASSRGVEVRVSVPETVELLLERDRMERVFVNLITNAIEAMPHGGEIYISASADSNNVIIEIDDTGLGIPPELRDTLFHPFASAGKNNGLGLGLVLSRQTVLDHGGDLTLSDKPEPGAHFKMTLPLSAVPAATHVLPEEML
jgi:signal transduction histidine kinase